MNIWASLAITIFILVGVVSCKASVWNECRASNSWTYCMAVIGK